MKTTTILLALSIVSIASILTITIKRAIQNKHLKKIAEEGYETAIDVLYPRKKGSKKLQYSPTLPG